MKRILLLATVLSFGFVGCVSSPEAPVDTRVTIAPNLGRTIHVTDARCVRGKSSYYTFQANVVNTTGSERRVEWKVQWLDEDGIEIDSITSTWNSLALQPYEIRALKGTAPSLDAADMRIYIREMR